MSAPQSEYPPNNPKVVNGVFPQNTAPTEPPTSTNQIAAGPSLKQGLTAEEKKFYSQLFKSLDTEGLGIVTGEKARSTFENSGLSPAVLGEIWQVSDQGNLGFLSQYGFCVAMRLIGHVQSGKSLSPALADVAGPLPRFSNMAIQPQSTNQSFSNFQAQPSAIVPQNTTTAKSVPQENIQPVNSADVAKFGSLFNKTAVNGELNGEEAKNIFLKARLPMPILGQIWNLVDRQNLGKLDMGSFVVAMHLIQGLISGSIKQLPPFLPQNVWDSVNPPAASPVTRSFSPSMASPSIAQDPSLRQSSYSSVSSTQTVRHQPDWIVTPPMKKQFDSIFESIDKSKVGTLQPDQVANFLMTSNLNQDDLASVWDLSDIQNTGVFTKLEFSIAVYLVNKRIQGGELPNIVPQSLIDSISASARQLEQPPAQVTQPPAPIQPPAQPEKPKTALDDLVDIFGSTPPPVPSKAPIPVENTLPRVRTSTAGPAAAPSINASATGSRFIPSSSFGQTLLQQQQEKADETPSLLGDDSTPSISEERPTPTPPAQQQAVASTPQPAQINYDALRAVPPPPARKQTGPIPVPVVNAAPPTPTYSAAPIQAVSRQASFQPQSRNDDLLADTNPEVSGKLSQATTDIANVSTQIRSLSSQAIGLRDKKTRAETELAKILGLKSQIEEKLAKLRSAYENEVGQVSVVEDSLQKSKEESEMLRSEASMAEAKYNQLQTDVRTKQAELENSQRENASLKEKLGALNSQNADLEKQVENLTFENKSLNNTVTIKQSQVEVAVARYKEYQENLRSLEASNLEAQRALELLESHFENSQTLVEAEEPVASQSKEISAESSHSSGLIAGVVGGAALGGVLTAAASTVGSSNFLENSIETLQQGKEQGPTDRDSISHASTLSQGNPFFQGNESASQSNLLPAADIEKGYDEVNEHFSEKSNRFAPSTIITDGTNETNTETPSSSPPTSDFQYSQNYGGIAGGMVGMPGVPIGLHRSESVTSSVQNNASLSVRDDNLDDLSETDIPEERTALASEVFSAGEPEVEADTSKQLSEDSFAQDSASHDAENDKISSGVESFEMVNAEDTADTLPAVSETTQEIGESHEIKEEVEPEASASSEGTSIIPGSLREVKSSVPEFGTDSLTSPVASAAAGFVGFASTAAAAIGLTGHNEENDAPAAPLEPENREVIPETDEPSSTANIDEEFPPIKELEYDESSSDDDDEEAGENNQEPEGSDDGEFDDALDQLPQERNLAPEEHIQAVPEVATAVPITAVNGFDDFDSQFDNLVPAEVQSKLQEAPQQAKEKDLFADEFDNLEEAEEETEIHDQTQGENFDSFGDFGGASFYGNNGFSQPFEDQQQQHPFGGLDEPESGEQTGANDEWDQLFAGFGNSKAEGPITGGFSGDFPEPPAVAAAPIAKISTTPRDLAVEELTGMGFDKEVATEALEGQNWDLEAATNYLLDHA